MPLKNKVKARAATNPPPTQTAPAEILSLHLFECFHSFFLIRERRRKTRVQAVCSMSVRCNWIDGQITFRCEGDFFCAGMREGDARAYMTNRQILANICHPNSSSSSRPSSSNFNYLVISGLLLSMNDDHFGGCSLESNSLHTSDSRRSPGWSDQNHKFEWLKCCFSPTMRLRSKKSRRETRQLTRLDSPILLSL